MDPAQKMQNLRDNLDKETIKEKTVQNWHLGALAGIFLLAFYLRYMPEKGMQYLQAADPYYIFRMSQQIALEGHLPQLDFMRYFPYATPNYGVQLGELLIPAVLYNLGFSLLFPNYLEFAQFFPAMMGALTVILIYFLGKELFNKKTGLAAAFFLTVISASLRRASAGFFEKEPIGTFLMIFSLLFFTRAWKKESWPDGILSGLALGIFTISWGGSQMLWLLYPLLTGITLFINEETRSLITSYTPTIVVAAGVAAASNPGRFWFTDQLFLISAALLGLLWMRYLVEEFEVIQDKYLPYFVPSMSLLGIVMAILSPLYSQWVTRKILGVIRVAVGDTGNSVVGQTVQENAAPGINSLATDLGSVLFGNVNGLVDVILILASPWTLMLFSVTFVSTSLLMMLGRKYSVLEETVSGKKYVAYTQAVFVAVMIFAAGLVQNMVIISMFAALMIAASMLTMIYYLEEDSAFTIVSMFLAGLIVALGIASLRFSGGLTSAFSYLTVLPAIAAATASFILYKLDYFPERTIGYKWYLLIPLVWVVSNVYGGTTRARLVFLSTFAVALAAGHATSVILNKLRELDYSQVEFMNSENLKTISVIAVIVLLAGMNLASGAITAQNIRGSPSPSPQIWEQSLDYMENETPEGSVTLSWWDYGYNFQTLGRTGSVADGGNLRYYGSTHQNQFLANYLNSTTANDSQFIQKHSADYIWLDHSMIGKFAAVSQIANNDNRNFEVIGQFGTPGSLQNSISQDSRTNQTSVYTTGRLRGLPVEVFTPIERSTAALDISGSPTVRLNNGNSYGVSCVLHQNGTKQQYELGINQEPLESSQIYQQDYCAAEDPFYSLERGTQGGQSRIVLVPEKISDSTFVELYIQDGENVDYAEKVPEASNSYIKMWEITE